MGSWKESVESVVCNLSSCGITVLTAPPGAGKSTLLPLELLDRLNPEGKILMLEPRRLAARGVADRMASLLGEETGETIGYRIRFEKKISSKTRLEVLTEGILTRMLVDDPALEGVSILIFDEFHERSLTNELSLALVLESRRLLRPDLKILIMSATIDAGEICSALMAPLVESEGQMFPVRIIHEKEEATPENAAQEVARCIARAHGSEDGDILAFLPGEADIRRCADLLEGKLDNTDICPLYGNLSLSEQRKAIEPSSPGRRKVVVSTPIAETSLTIKGIKTVIDSGLFRKVIHDSRSGLEHLETQRISMDMATQRAGRAGRVSEGTCHRLWSLSTERAMAANRVPEILEADLASLYLSIVAWGENDPSSLPWLTPPPQSSLSSAKELLTMLGAIDSSGSITQHGKRLSSLPCHPRIAQLLISASTPSEGALAADIAAILEEKDPMSISECGSSVALRVFELRASRRKEHSSGNWRRITMVAEQYRRLIKVQEDCSEPSAYAVGRLIASAYPERIARSMPSSFGRYQLSGTGNVLLDNSDDMSASEWIAIASMNARQGGDGKVFLCAPLDPKDLRTKATEYENISWDSSAGKMVARRELRIGRLVLESVQINDIAQEKAAGVICSACRKEGKSILNFDDEVENLQRRVAAASSWHPELELPDLSTESVLERVSEWLPLYIGKARSREELKKINLSEALWGLLSYEQQTMIERLAPSHITVPTGSRIKVEYRIGAEKPVVRVRLQECFGLQDTPCVDEGRLPVLMELLSPGFKPVQLTSDLKSFWSGTYFEVRKELRRRYPKHSWPENPLEASPTRSVKHSK